MERSENLLWISLPIELLVDIFEYLPLWDLLQVRLVCKCWRDVTYLPTFLVKFKLSISNKNLLAVYESFKNNKHFSKTMVYKTLKLRKADLSNDLHQALKCLGSNVDSLKLKDSEVLPILNECFPQLRELTLIKVYFQREEDILALDLRKFKHFKSLDLNHSCIPHFVQDYLLKNLTDEPPFKMEKICLTLKHKDDEDLVMRFLQYHSDSLKHLELVMSTKLTLLLQWKQVFQLLTKLNTLQLVGDFSCLYLSDIIHNLPKAAPLRNCDLSGGLEVDDKLLKLIVDKWSGSLEDIKLNFCDEITDEGVQHLSKLKDTLKALHVAYCSKVTADRLLHGLAAERNTKLKFLTLSHTADSKYINVLAERLPELRVLILGGCRNSVDDYTLQSIFYHQVKLHCLNLNDCIKISDAGLIGFGSAPASISNLKGLHSLSLRGCKKVSDHSLIQTFKLSELRQLLFGYCDRITSKGIKEVVKNCPVLEKLTISSCSRIDDNAILLIARGLMRLRYLNVSNCNKITGKSLDYIIQYSKSLKIVYMLGIKSLHKPELKEKFRKLQELNINVNIVDYN